MSYVLEFTIEGLPKTTNSNSRTHWRAQSAEAKKWKQLVIKTLLFDGYQLPKKPLEKASIVLTRYSSKESDFDGLVSSFKHVLDGLKASKVILDDKVSIIGQPKYQWDQVKPREGFIRVKVEEIA